MRQEIINLYGNKIRVRACGILLKKNKALMLNHLGLNKENCYWGFPGGGIEIGETLENCIKREYIEEVNLKIETKNLCYINEFINEKLHAIEFFFFVESKNYKVNIGNDPELNILSNLKWFSWKEITNLPKNQRPHFLDNFTSFLDLKSNISFLSL